MKHTRIQVFFKKLSSPFIAFMATALLHGLRVIQRFGWEDYVGKAQKFTAETYRGKQAFEQTSRRLR